MKDEKTMTLNEKGMLMIGIVILTLILALAVMVSSKRREQNITIFTREDLEKIEKLQSMEDKEPSGAEIFAYKDKDGNLMIGWKYD